MRRRVLISLVAGVLGFAVNQFQVTVLDGVEMVFGFVFPLAIALAFGPAWGTGVATISSVATAGLWRNWLSIPVHAVEALVIGWLARRRVPPIVAALAFWGVAAPLIHFLLVKYFGTSRNLAVLVVWKATLNGLLNLLLAESFLVVGAVRRILNGAEADDLPLRTILLRAFIFITVVPLTFLTVVNGRAYERQYRLEAESRLKETAATIGNACGSTLASYQRTIELIAAGTTGGEPTTNEMVRKQLDECQKRFDGFLTLLATDAAGNKIIGLGVRAADGGPNFMDGGNVADREYFQVPARTGKPFVSEVFLGRGFGRDPVVAVSAPYFTKTGEFAGIVEGSLNLMNFARFAAVYKFIPEVDVTITDQQFRVIYGDAATGFRSLDRLADTPLAASVNTTNGKPFRYVPAGGEPVTVYPATVPRYGWHVFVRQPQRVIDQGIQQYYFRAILWGVLAVLVAFGLATIIARNTIRPLEHLVDVTRGLNLSGSISYPPFRARTAPAEVTTLLDVFETMVGKLDTSYRNLRRAVEDREAANRDLQALSSNLDGQVRERTAELAQTIERLRQAQAETERKNEQLFQAQKMEVVGQIAGGVAHNFNNLLAIILGYAGLLGQRLESNEASRKPVTAIIEASERGRDLVKQLMSFSRKVEMSPRRLDPAQVLDRFSRLIVPVIPENIQVVRRAGTNLARIYVDPVQIEQVLLNLVLNARDAMPKGGSLTIEAWNAEIRSGTSPDGVCSEEAAPRAEGKLFPGVPEEASGAFVRFTVRDTGRGIDEQVLARVFEPFFTTKGPQGTGLGLATVFGIVTQAGGFLQVDSRTGEGTAFHVYLPGHGRPSGSAEITSELAVEPPLVTAGSRGVVLVVEDEPPVRAVIRDLLAEEGFSVLEAASGDEALTLCRESLNTIRAVISDVMMPGLSGIDLVERISAVHPGIKVLLMTGYSETTMTVGNGVAVLNKPFTPADLYAAIDRLLG